MARVRVRVVSEDGRWTVNLPRFMMVPGTMQAAVPGLTDGNSVLPGVTPATPGAATLTVECDVDPRDCNPRTGRPDPAPIRTRYRGQPRWDRPDLDLGVV